MAGTAAPIILSDRDKENLESIVRARTSAVRAVERARIVLLAAAGKANQHIAAELGIAAHTVGRWRTRFATGGIDAIEDRPRSGRRPTTANEVTPKILNATLHTKPPGGATQWSTRSLERFLGVNRELI